MRCGRCRCHCTWVVGKGEERVYISPITSCFTLFIIGEGDLIFWLDDDPAPFSFLFQLSLFHTCFLGCPFDLICNHILLFVSLSMKAHLCIQYMYERKFGEIVYIAFDKTRKRNYGIYEE